MLIADSGGSRQLILRKEWVEEEEYRQTIEEFEPSEPWCRILCPPMVVGSNLLAAIRGEEPEQVAEQPDAE